MNKTLKKFISLLLAIVMVILLGFNNKLQVAAANVDTVLSNESGINLSLYDYNDTDETASINETVKNKGLEGYIKWTGSLNETHPTGQYAEDKYGEGFIHGMVSNQLIGGYPVILGNYHDQDNQIGSLGFLFGGESDSAVTAYNTNGGLFWETADGYYEYYSDEHAADYDVNDNRFYVRDYTETTESTAGRGLSATSVGRNDFLPFNHTNGTVVGTHSNGNNYHVSNADVNYWFGLKLDAAFEQPKDGILDNGNQMVFEFTGDDDVWLYIDGVLVLDMGGTHAASSGTINFATGEITYTSYNSNNNQGLSTDGTGGTGYDEALGKYTIKECFVEAGLYSEDAFDGNTLADYTRHRIDYFYMERGSSSSCCHIKFNIPTIPTAKVGITKNVESVYDETALNKQYQMKLYVETEAGSDEYEPYKGVYTLRENNGTETTKFTDSEGKFALSHSQTALFDVPLGRTYFVEEYETDGYKVTYKHDNGNASDANINDETNVAKSEIYEISSNGCEILVNNRITLTDISGIKTWDDNDNQDGIRPESIIVNLVADGKVVASKEVTDAEDWTYTFKNVPIYNDEGEIIEYTITEEDVNGYDVSVEGYNLTNKHTPSIIDIAGSKTWDDADNQDGIRPESIIINLFADGEKVDSKTITADDDWKWSFTNLSEYKAGKKIEYTITEEIVDGYETKVDNYNVTNKHTPATTSVEGIKTWNDNNDQDGVRPESITINLYADDEKIDSKTVTADDDWAWSFTDLPKYRDQGVEIIYTIDEDAVEGYETTVNGYDVTNAYTPATTSVEGSKTWNDNNDQDGVRPESITINLYADDEKIDSKVVTADDNWTWSFTDLPKYRDHGTEIEYTITEEAVEGYETTVNGYDVTNSYTPATTSVEGSKTWNDNNDQDGIRPAAITVNLLADGEVVDTATASEATDWAWSFKDLPKYRDHGTEIIYTIEEVTVEGYETEVNGYDLTNTHTPATTSVEGNKTWNDADNQDGLRPESITINLFADGKAIDSKTVTADDDWAWSFTDLPKYRDHGTEIVYTITEDKVPGYAADVDGYDVTNNHTPAVVSVEGTKTWDDANNQDGVRPESITISLLADGKVIETKELTASDNWAWSFTDLPKYRDQGVEIIYTIEEDTVAGYETVINGYNVTNTHEPEKTSVSGVKTWIDNDNQDGKRPESITVNLLANGEVVASKEVTASDNWAWTFDNLDKYEAGEEIIYTVEEEITEGYNPAYDGFDIANTYDPEKINIIGHKIWNDDFDRDGIRPDSVTVYLYADGKLIDKQTVTALQAWTWSFTGLDRYRDGGVPIIYTITEKPVKGYATAIVGHNVVNTHIPETVNLEGSKTWNDNNDQDGLRPENIVINLYADGVKIKSVVVSEEDGWDWEFKHLPKYRHHGIEIDYTITENPVDGYTTTVDGLDVTNTHIPEVTSVSGTKTWDDADNQDGVRPETITIKLLADGKVIETVEVSAEDAWTWTFDNLPKYRDQGIEIIYTIEEDAVDGYETVIDGLNVTNTHIPEVTSVSGTKTWDDADNQDGIRPESIVIYLLADGEIIATKEVTEADNWTWTFDNLPKYKDQGVEIIYTIQEEAVEGYETTIDGLNVTNTHVPEVTSVSGSKTWDDADDKDGLRPESITIYLLANGEVIDTKEVTEDDDWTWAFDNLPKYEAGTEIAYEIDEEAVEGYETTVDGYDVTNTHIPEDEPEDPVIPGEDPEEPDDDPEDDPKEPAAPDTGDHSNIGFNFIMMCLAACTIKFVLEFKRVARRRR